MKGNLYIELPEQAFMPAGTESKETETIVRPSITFWKDVLRRLLKNRVAMVSLVIIIIVLLLSIFAPIFSPYKYSDTNFAISNQTASGQHIFGTDRLGRDIWTRIWVGGKVSLIIGFLGAIVPTIIGMIIGGISGFFGGKIDMLIMRMVDVCMCIPSMIYLILIMIYLGSGPVSLIIAFAITGWMGSARIVRGLVLMLKEREFILAARTLGASPARLIARHLIPNTLGIVVVGITMAVPAAIFQEAFLSFIGLGVQSPMTSWGQLVKSGMDVFRIHPYQLIIPSVFISISMLAFNLFGDGLRDALDPRLRT